jgi:hypothetical protein
MSAVERLDGTDRDTPAESQARNIIAGEAQGQGARGRARLRPLLALSP